MVCGMNMPEFWGEVLGISESHESITGQEAWFVKGSEVADLIRRVIDGSASMRCSGVTAYNLVMPVFIEDSGKIWKVAFFIDDLYLDYCEGAIVDDRKGSFEVWSELGEEPIERLTSDEVKRFEELLSQAARQSEVMEN